MLASRLTPIYFGWEFPPFVWVRLCSPCFFSVSMVDALELSDTIHTFIYGINNNSSSVMFYRQTGRSAWCHLLSYESTPWKWNTVTHCSASSPWNGCTYHSSGLLLLLNQPEHQFGRVGLSRLLECLTELCFLRYNVLDLKMFYMIWSPLAKARGQVHHGKSMLMVACPKTSVFKPIQKKRGMAWTITSQLRSLLG